MSNSFWATFFIPKDHVLIRTKLGRHGFAMEHVIDTADGCLKDCRIFFVTEQIEDLLWRALQ